VAVERCAKRGPPTTTTASIQLWLFFEVKIVHVQHLHCVERVI